MLKFEDYRVTPIIGKETGYFCNAIGHIIFTEIGFLQSQYPAVWGWTMASYIIANERMHLVWEEPNFYA